MTSTHLLIVSQDAGTRALMAAVLIRALNCVVYEAASLEQARSIFAAERPEVVVLTLPPRSASEPAIAFLAEVSSDAAVIAVMPERSWDGVQALLARGALDVLAVPVVPQRLTESAARALRWSKIRRERDLLREQTARQAQEFNALYTVGRNVSALLKIEDILNLVVTAAVNLTRADEGSLMLLDPDSGELHLRASRTGSEDTVQLQRVKVNDTLMGRVIQSGRPVMLGSQDLLKVKTSFLVKSILSVPVLAAQRPIGVLNVYNIQNSRPFTEHDVHLLSTLADAAAIAIQNAQLYEQTRRNAEMLAAQVEIERHISASLDLTTVLERIALHAKDLLHTDDSEVYLLSNDNNTLHAIVALGDYAEAIKAQPVQVGHSIVGFVAQSGVAEMVNEVEQDARRQTIPGTPEEHEALLCAPLVFKGQTLGAMVVARVGEHPPFEQPDFEFFKGLAAQAAIAIENARLYDSERRRAAELARALDQQRELDRLKNEFVQNVSHELRTPLAIIRGYAELMDAGDLGPLADDQRTAVDVITRRSLMLSKMLDDLLTILSAETGRMDHTPVDIVQLVRTSLVDFELEVKKANVTVQSRIEPPVAPVFGDVAHLRRVIDNLLSNALKFTPAGGQVLLALYQLGQEVILEVADTGIGISPEHLNRVFERFYQVDGSTTRRYGGVGLGLALVKEIVAAHGGHVQAFSTVGKGTQFRISLPAMPSPSTPEEPNSTA